MPVDKTKMMAECDAMKRQKQTLADDLNAQNSLLTTEVDRMNRAGTGLKTTLMATLLTHMVEQRVTMDARKAAMDDEMMKHTVRVNDFETAGVGV